MRFLKNNFYLLSIFSGGTGALLMFILLFKEPIFFHKPVYEGFSADANGTMVYLRTYPKVIYAVWFAITRMAFYFVILTPLILFFAEEWKKIKTIKPVGILFRIIIPIIPLLIIRLLITLQTTHTDNAQNLLISGSKNIFALSSILGLLIAIISTTGILLSAVHASSVKNFSANDYSDAIKGVNFFLVILGLAVSFSAVWHLLFRNAYVQIYPKYLAENPVEWAYGVALINTLLIALVYFPVRLYLEYLKNKNTETASTVQQISTGIWMSLFTELKTMIPVFSPILSTVLAGALG